MSVSPADEFRRAAQSVLARGGERLEPRKGSAP